MRLVKPKFWLKKNYISFILYPLSIFVKIVNFYKNLAPKKNFNLKIICIGNIYIGGTGKTSLAIEIYKILNKKFDTIFVKKKYENQFDEFMLLKKRGKILSHDKREISLTKAQKKYSVAILDDGLQQKNIKYDLKIACFNSHDGFGNGFLIPAGPLRESLNELKNYHVVFLNGTIKNNILKKKIKKINPNLKIFESTYQPENLNKLNRNKNYLMFCGLGNPQEFEKTLLKFKFKIKKKIIFPDHYKLSDKKIENLKNLAKKEKLNIITTEKDYLRLGKNQKNSINYLKIKLKINEINKFKKVLNKII